MEFVYAKLLEQKQQGLATLLISEDLDELMLLCSRIGVMYRGQIMGILNRDQFDKYQIGRLMSGVRNDE
jgi:simple sugar transport system ATP-binding protein